MNELADINAPDLLIMLKVKEARRSFYEFRKLMNPTFKDGWWQSEVAELLQRFYDDFVAGKRPKLVIQAPPQHGKSMLIIDFIAWVAGKNPDLKTIYTSFSDRLGVRANFRLRRMFDNPLYKEMFPSIQLDGLVNQNIIEYSGYEGLFRNTTVNGSITGESLDLGIIDDPIKSREEANSETIRDKAWDWFTDDFFTRFSEGAGLLAILTRWHIDDPIGRLIERSDDVQVASYPAIAIDDEKDDDGKIKRRKGEALFPEHKSIEFLLERKAMMDATSWEALYQQSPIIEDGELFKPDQINVVDAIPKGDITWCRGWDLASSTDGDYTAGVLLGRMSNGQLIVGDVKRFRYTTDQRDAAIINTASADGYGTKVSIPQDAGQAGKSLALYLTRALSGYNVNTSPETGSKVVRAEPIASQVNVGNLMLIRGHWNKDFLEELRLFPNGVHDDQVDALSRAFGELFTPSLGWYDL